MRFAIWTRLRDATRGYSALLRGFLFAGCVLSASLAVAETLEEALAHTYLINPQLNAQRANTRGVDENISIARGAFLPQAVGQANSGIMNQNLLSSKYSQSAFDSYDLKTITNPVGATFIVSVNVFNGFRGVNGVNQAEAQIHQSRALLRNSEITVLLSAVNAYMDVARDTAVLKLRDDYVRVLELQVETTKERLIGGEVTMTDVYQAETALSQARQERIAAFVRLQGSIAGYRQITGQTPVNLAPARPVDHLIPRDFNAARQEADVNHPLANAAHFNVEVINYSVNIAEGKLLPTLNVEARFGQNWNYFGTKGQRLYQGSGGFTLNVPIYEGGITYGEIRQAKEKLGEARLTYDQQINQINQQLEANWATWQNAERYLKAARDQVKNAEKALAGVREEAKFGQRTTWDILNYQATLVAARIAFVNGQRERVVSSYATLASIGKLSAEDLGLKVPLYSVSDHYDRVNSQFIGVEPWK